MTAGTGASGWIDANQRYLTARLTLVRVHLASRAAPKTDAPREGLLDEAAETAVRRAAEAMPAPAALDALCQAFALSPFERDVLVMCAGAELDSAFEAVWAGRGQRRGPTFGQALDALPDGHWSALTPASPLRRWRMVEVAAGDTLTGSLLRIDENVLHYLTGISLLDERLDGFVEPLSAPRTVPAAHASIARRIAEIWGTPGAALAPVIHLEGNDTTGKRRLAAFACASLGIELRLVAASDVPASIGEREPWMRLWERDATLRHSALLIDGVEGADQARTVTALAERLQGPVLVALQEPLPLRQRRVVRFEVDRPSATEQVRLWREALGPIATQLNGALEALVSHFDLGAGEIEAASVAVSAPDPKDPAGVARALWEACRTNARGRLSDLAQRLDPVAGWDDLVLPPSQTQTLREIASHVRHRARVHDAWGFASKGARGLGISALFAGPSGTGKTMAAEVLARELAHDLFRIDLSQVVSKYIGETEKNLRRVFEAAEAGGAILLFDEADALFGKRSEVKDSHDRYANIEISYLLQRMESYRGLAILTTNMKSSLDPAFLRRLRFIVQFPFPDSAQRAEIWRRIYPSQTPVEDLDVSKLARLNVAGGNIRNIALQAAFLAAETKGPVRMTHLLRAARSEYGKLDKQLTEAESKDWT